MQPRLWLRYELSCVRPARLACRRALLQYCAVPHPFRALAFSDSVACPPPPPCPAAASQGYADTWCVQARKACSASSSTAYSWPNDPGRRCLHLVLAPATTHRAGCSPQPLELPRSLPRRRHLTNTCSGRAQWPRLLSWTLTAPPTSWATSSQPHTREAQAPRRWHAWQALGLGRPPERLLRRPAHPAPPAPLQPRAGTSSAPTTKPSPQSTRCGGLVWRALLAACCLAHPGVLLRARWAGMQAARHPSRAPRSLPSPPRPCRCSVWNSTTACRSA